MSSIGPPFFRPVYLLQAEGLCTLIASFVAYHSLFPHHWILFAWLFFIPDLSLLGYLQGAHPLASAVYNVMHTYALPALLGIVAAFLHNVVLGEMSLIWVGHIGMDRSLGYGLKYPASFQFTHIQSAANPLILPDITRDSKT